jgi:hypothetical protein
MVGWNQVEGLEALPAAVVELERSVGPVFRIFKVPVIELRVLWSVDESLTRHPAEYLSVTYLRKCYVLCLHDSIPVLALELEWGRHHSTPTPSTVHLYLNETSIHCCRWFVLFVLKGKDEGSLL